MLRRASAILVLLYATGCAAAAMLVRGSAASIPAVPPRSMSPSKLDAYRMPTVFTQRQRRQALFASCLRAKGYQQARE